jgi:hypothetical protein
LRAEHLFDRLRPPRAGFDGGVVGDDDRFALGDDSDSGDHARRRSLPVILIIGDQQSDLLKPGSRIEQACDAFTRGELALPMLAFDLVRAAALNEPIFQGAQFAYEILEVSTIGINRGFLLRK